MAERDLPYQVALARLEMAGTIYIKKAISALGGAKVLFSADSAELISAGLRPETAQMLVRKRSLVDPSAEMRLVERAGVTLLPPNDHRYPQLLKEIPDSPLLLFARGNLEVLNHRLPLAIVGTRSMSLYGKRVTGMLAGPLAAAGVCIVSGLALGVDAVAHEAALGAGGSTVAVLGSGIDDKSITPRSNLRVAQRIIKEGGAIISEYPPGSEGLKPHFPMRNRIIAGMSRGTLVIEAAERSGALITARCALDYNRDVFAVPGPITQKTCAGTNKLIAGGAALASSAEDILDYWNLANPGAAARPTEPRTKEERLVMTALADEPLNADEIAQKTALPMPALLSATTSLEINGLVAKIADKFYLKNQPR